MKYKKYILTILFFILAINTTSFAQNQAKIDSLEKAYSNFTFSQNDSIQSEILRQLVIEYEYNNIKKSISYCKKGIKLGKNAKNFIILSFWYGRLGAIYRKLEIYNLALEYFIKGAKLSKQNNQNSGWWHIEVGNIYYAQNINLQKAIIQYEKSIAEFEKIKSKDTTDYMLGTAVAYNNIGMVYEKKQDYKKALQYYLDAFQIRKIVQEKNDLAHSCLLIAQLYTEIEDYDNALEYYNSGLIYAEKSKQKNLTVDLFLYKALMFAKMRNFELAFKEFNNAEQKAKELNSTLQLINIYYNIAEVYLQTNEPKIALLYSQKGKKRAKKIEHNVFLSKYFLQLSNIYEVINDFENAFIAQKEYFKINELIDNQDLIKIQLNYEIEQEGKQTTVLQEDIKTLHKKNKISVWLIILIGILLIYSLIFVISFRNNTKLLKKQKQQIVDTLKIVNIEKTKVEQVKDALKESEQKFKTITKSANDAVILINNDSEISLWNQAAEKIFGYTQEEIIGNKIYKIIPQKYRSKHKNGFSLFRETGKGPVINKTIELEALRKNSEIFPIEISISAIKLKGKWMAVGIIRDITERKKAEQELIKAKAKAEQSNRLKSEFLANMSHEIRTPMNSILGFSSILKRKINTPQELDYLERINRNGNNLLKLINDILVLAEVDSGSMQIQNTLMNLNILIKELKQSFEEKIKDKNLKLILELDEKLSTTIRFDNLKLNQIFTNLIDNAIKFTKTGNIKIITKLIDQTETDIDFSIEVDDTGIGISAEQQKIIFNKFQQVEGQDSRHYGGTGLGLAIVKQLIVFLNGTITVSSELGKGAKFKIYFEKIKLYSKKNLNFQNNY